MPEIKQTPFRYDVPLSFPVAVFSSALPRNIELLVETDEVDSRYFDTDSFDLLQQGMILRCWTSSTDSGWQLSTVAEDGTYLLKVAFNTIGTTPDEVLAASAGLRLGRELSEVARIQVDRTTSRLASTHTNDGSEGLCLIDDSLRATAHGRDGVVSATQWRELTLDGRPEPPAPTLAELDQVVLRAGAKAVAAGGSPGTALAQKSPLVKALAGLNPVAGAAVRSAAERNPVLAYVSAQREALAVNDVALRLGAGDIHATRVATRRLRSTLGGFISVWPAGQLRELDRELAWYAGVLGEVRDRQVLAERLLAAVSELAPELVLGPVSATISERLGLETQHHRTLLAEAMGSERYFAILGQLNELVAELAVSRAPKARDIALQVVKAEGRVKRRLSEAVAQLDSPAGDTALHSARKAAKRARYAAELAAPAIGAKSSAKKTKRYRQLQDLLGKHQDGLIASELLRAMGAAAAASPGQNGFTFGVLYEREQAAAQRSRELAAAWIADN